MTSRPVRGADLLAAVDRLELPALTSNRDQVITWGNRELKRLFGDDVVGRSVLDLAAPESRRTLRDAHARKLIGGAESTRYDAVLVTRSGTPLLVEIASSPLANGDDIVGVFGFGRPRDELPQGSSPRSSRRGRRRCCAC